MCDDGKFSIDEYADKKFAEAVESRAILEADPSVSNFYEYYINLRTLGLLTMRLIVEHKEYMQHLFEWVELVKNYDLDDQDTLDKAISEGYALHDEYLNILAERGVL